MTAIMLDLETFGTRPDAQITQIGAVAFEPAHRGKIYINNCFNQYVLVQDGVGTIDHATLAWWLMQGDAARGTLAKGMAEHAVSLAEALQGFNDWFNDFPRDTTVWSKPADFDIAILRSAFNRIGCEPPWDRRATRCLRTYFSLIPGGEPRPDKTGVIAHDAQDDAIYQAQQFIMAQEAL